MADFYTNNLEEMFIDRVRRDGFGYKASEFSDSDFPKYLILRVAFARALKCPKIPLKSPQWQDKQIMGDKNAKKGEYHLAQLTGKGKYVRTIMEKTNKLVNVPLSKEALNCLNEKEDPNEPIFTLPGTPTVCHDIRKWMQNADIKKHISFHCSRHTFATMMLTLGVDIYTTSKLLGHSNVSTTQIYSKIVDEKKVEAVNKVDSLFD